MNVCVYCSSSDDVSQKYIDLARRVGTQIGAEGNDLVFGGIRRGLMREVAEAAQAAGARVTGVIPESKRDLAEQKDCHLNDENIFTPGIGVRKSTMIMMSTRFIVLPGGYGTLDELFTTITEIVFGGLAGREIFIYNPDGLYNPLIEQLKTMADHRLLSAKRPLFTVIDC